MKALETIESINTLDNSPGTATDFTDSRITVDSLHNANNYAYLIEQIRKRLSQMKHQLDTTLCRFYFCRVTLHVSGASAHHQEYLKLVQRPLVHVL